VSFLPISGITGANLMYPLEAGVCDWYQGPSLVQVLDGLRPPKRDAAAPLRIPVLDRIKDAGKVFIEGKIESGTVRLGQRVLVMPNKQAGVVQSIASDFAPELDAAAAGENVRIVVSGVSDDQIRAGFVVCDADHPILPIPQFEAQLAVIDLLDHKPIISPGYTAVFHAHTAVEECTIKLLLGAIDRKTGEVSKQKPKFIKKGAFVSARIQLSQPVCLDTYKEFPQLGRFTLRDEGKTIAIGKVIRLPAARPGAK
jgi:peptide chain release factor subunit 3